MTVHAERRRLPYRPDQMYDVVAGVEHYPEFLPWCSAARIKTREGDVFTAEMVIAFKFVRERFTSRVTLEPKRAVHVEYVDGPFKYLRNRWGFEPTPEGGCVVDFHVDFEFKSRILQNLIGLLFNEAVRRMVAAFEARARALYGPPSPASPPAGAGDAGAGSPAAGTSPAAAG